MVGQGTLGGIDSTPAVVRRPCLRDPAFYQGACTLRKLLFVFAASAAALVFPAAAHAICYGVTLPTGNVCGSIRKMNFSGPATLAGPTSVVLCPRGSTSNCRGAVTTLRYDGYGSPYQNFTIPNFSQYYGLTGY